MIRFRKDTSPSEPLIMRLRKRTTLTPQRDEYVLRPAFGPEDNHVAGTILPALTMQMKAAESLTSVELKNPTPERTVGIVWRNGGYLSKAALEFARILGEHVDN